MRKKDENYYPKAFSEKYKVITIEEKMSICNDSVETYCNNSDKEYFDDCDGSDEKNSDRKVRMKKISCINLLKKRKML